VLNQVDVDLDRPSRARLAGMETTRTGGHMLAGSSVSAMSGADPGLDYCFTL
jgi:hypothetical protein